VVGLGASRELPVVGRIALGSLKNKLFYLLPAAIALSAFAPWAITPLLMAGGLYLCFEGYEKVHEWIAPLGVPATASPAAVTRSDAKALEEQRIAGAIRTDFILSAEIMAISLAAIETPSLLGAAMILAVVAVLVTAGVYGAVALIVKADDVGVALAQSLHPVSHVADLVRCRRSFGAPTAADVRVAPVTQAIGRGLVTGMPRVLAVLSVVGTLAMLWVGGGIVLHGLAHYGFAGPEHAFAAVGEAIGGFVPLIGWFISWLVNAALAGVVGLALGWVTERAWVRVSGR
jgi:uncharacterized protein